MQKIISRKFIAILTSICFLFSEFGSGTLWAVAGPPQPVPASGQIRNLSELKIPEEWGTVRELRSKNSGKPFVIYIQDAHGVYDAQQNIQNLIQYLSQQYGVNLIALEGAKSRLDPTLLRAFPNDFIKEKILRQYLKRGEISGAELASVLGSPESEFVGLEDWELYEKNYQSYLEASQNQPALQKKLKEIQSRLDNQRTQVYSPELNRFHDAVRAFYREDIHILELFQSLQPGASREIFKKYPELQKLAAWLILKAKKIRSRKILQ